MIKWLEDYQVLIDSALTILIAFAAVTGVFMSIKSLANSRRDNQLRLLREVLQEYQDPDLGKAVASLWDFFRDKCQESRDKLIANYLSMLKIGTDMSLHYDR